MSALSKIDNKLVFSSGNRPSETDFSNLIDSYTQYSELLEHIGTAISQQTGVLEIVSASATAHSILPTRLGGTGEGSLSSAQDAFFQGQTGLAIVTSANRFTNTNTFAATATNFISSATGSNEGPFLVMDKPNSQSDGDNLASILIKGADSGGNSSTYAKIRGQIVSTSASNENGRFQIITIVSGATAVRFNIGGGLYSTNASGGDTGIDTINVSEVHASAVHADELFDNGSQIYTRPVSVVSAVSFPAAAQVEVSGLDFSNYGEIIVNFTNLSTGSNARVDFQLGDDTDYTTTIDYRGATSDESGVTVDNWVDDSSISIGQVQSGNTLSGRIILRRIPDSHSHTLFSAASVGWQVDIQAMPDNTGATTDRMHGTGFFSTNKTITHVRWAPSTGSFDDGEWSIMAW